MEDLPLGGIAALVPEFAVKDLLLDRTLIMMIMNINTLYSKPNNNNNNDKQKKAK